MMRRTQVCAKSPSFLKSSICNHNKKNLTFGFSLSCFFHLSARQRLKFYCCQNLPCAASRGWSSPRRAQHLSSNKSFCPLFSSLTCLLGESRAQSSSAGRVSGGVGQESAFIEIVIVSPCSRVPLPIHLSSFPVSGRFQPHKVIALRQPRLGFIVPAGQRVQHTSQLLFLRNKWSLHALIYGLPSQTLP